MARLPIVGLPGILAAASAVAACRAAPAPSDETGTLALCEDCAEACIEEFRAPVPSPHVTGGVDYADPPPTSGEHDPCWARWGVSTEVVPDEKWVHNLEHGGVVFLYNCPDGCDDEINSLAALTEELKTFALLTPYPSLPARFGAVAWGWRHVTDCFEIDDFESFYLRHFNRAPESVPSDPDASCEG